ncbi:hypothetical protein H072_7094 [Dactylellina haptotyla CBS 200.50]|uniref:Uncharacterized protein n=1 Tax=Dactylellina haptotyla (strain CBS 200.50) TaxID=1284197 RepID=S8BV27_DACHA|nr:hypothetical protein H072_7094 [Dactylellina haptotyla CBS 200.50]
MRSANFANRKPKARIIASFDDDESDKKSAPPAGPSAMDTALDSNEDSSASIFKRKSAPTKVRKSVNRSLISLDDPHGEEASADALALTRPIVVKKSALTRQAVERSASTSQGPTAAAPKDKPRTTLKSTALPSQPFSQLSLTSRPSYSKEALAELKTSTPTTPMSRGSPQDDQDVPMADAPVDPLNVAGKFAAERASASVSARDLSIPDEGTIKALKARRAMLAQNPDYISLSEESAKSKGSRLQRTQDDEEEILETFVEDGGLALGRKAEREKQRRRREDIREAIDMVERPSDDEDASGGGTEDENGEWEANRIRTGGYGSSKRETLEEKLRKPPAVITPLPSFHEAVGKLKDLLAGMNLAMGEKEQRVEELLSEKELIEQRELELQKLLKDTSEKYERLREEAGTALHVGRGLENFGDDTTGTGIPAGV